jgi:xylitol oxidase
MHNWSGTYTFTAPRVVSARSIDEVQQTLASRDGGRVRALGTRHSFTDLADTTGTLVSVLDIAPDVVLDEAARTVTVGAGTRYGILAAWLQEHGWALHNMGSLPHISIGGATATGTHGSGDANGVLTTAIRAIEYVDARGELVRTQRGDADFDGMAVSLGAYGVVVRVTLDIQPSFRLRQDVYRGLPWEALLEHFDRITSAGYSVSLFTTWDEQRLGQLWVKTRLDRDDDPVADDLFGAARDRASADAIGEAFADNLTEQGGVPGPWSQRLPHFRLDSTPSNGDEIQTEYFVDRANAPAALRAVRTLAPRIAPHLLVSELRTAAPDTLWLSGAFERELVAIHFTWKNEPDAVSALLPEIQSALRDFDARPHWGKLHSIDAAEIARVTPRLADARALFERLDPEGVFTSAHLERVGVRAAR